MQRRKKDFSEKLGFFTSSHAYPQRKIITPQLLKEVIDALENNHLTTLDLSFTSLGDAGVKLIAQALPRNISLTSLNLKNCLMTDNSLRILVEAVCQNSSLVKIDVSFNLLIQTDLIARLQTYVQMNEIYMGLLLHSINRRRALETPTLAMPENRLMQRF